MTNAFPLMTKEEVAKALHLSTRTISNMMSDRRIPFIKFGPRCVRFNPEHVAEALGRFEVLAVRPRSP